MGTATATATAIRTHCRASESTSAKSINPSTVAWLLAKQQSTAKHCKEANSGHVFPCLVSGLTLQPKRTAEPTTPWPPIARPTHGQTGNDPCAIARGSPGEPGERGSRPCRPPFLLLLCSACSFAARERREAPGRGDDDGDMLLAHTTTAGQVSFCLLRASSVALPCEEALIEIVSTLLLARMKRTGVITSQTSRFQTNPLRSSWLLRVFHYTCTRQTMPCDADCFYFS
ncbi:hypothetical protein V8C34DRAFT_166672 [Trichoderma compactum]